MAAFDLQADLKSCRPRSSWRSAKKTARRNRGGHQSSQAHVLCSATARPFRPFLGLLLQLFRGLWLQVRFFGAARLSRAPKNARCSAQARAECASHVLLRSCRRILGASIFKVHMYLLCRGWAGAGGLGAALRSLVSPQRCTTTCFYVCLICTRLFGQGTPPII